MIDRLATLVKRVAELRQAGLEMCHCIEEFHLELIYPLSHRMTLTFECPRMADPSRDRLEGNIFVLSLRH
jgi:hypothetical protein